MKEKILICPKCANALQMSNGCFMCSQRHTYDIASSGYVNLNTKLTVSGDSPEMVRARSRFLDAGYYDPFADALINQIRKTGAKIIIDAGCGEGYYSNMIADKIEDAIVFGFDLSKSAVNKAAKRAHAQAKANTKTEQESERTSFFVCSIFDLPIKDESADAVINLFAPCASEEFYRVLKPGGHLFMGVAGKDHLLGLKDALYDEVYLNRPEKISAPEGFSKILRENIRYEVCVDSTQSICDLFSMTPYYWKTSEKDASKLCQLKCLCTVLDFDIIVFERL